MQPADEQEVAREAGDGRNVLRLYTRLHIRLPDFLTRKTLTQQGSLVRQVATLPKGVISITSANDLFRLAETQYKLARFLQEQSVNTMLTFSELLCVSIRNGRSSCPILFLASTLYDSARTPVKSIVQHIAKSEAGYMQASVVIHGYFASTSCVSVIESWVRIVRLSLASCAALKIVSTESKSHSVSCSFDQIHAMLTQYLLTRP